MEKNKFDTSSENSYGTFFDNEHFDNGQIVLDAHSPLLPCNAETEASEKIDSIISSIKLVFLFLPGAFSLYYFSLTFVYYNLFQGVGFRSDSGLNEFLFMRYFFEPLLGVFFLLSVSFITFIGIGRVKEVKNLVVPGSIICFSLLLGGLFSFLKEPIRGHVVMYYSVYLFPLTLVIANLTKGWVNEKEDQ